MVRRLESLHLLGYVHCDISPENILMGPAHGVGGAAGTSGRGVLPRSTNLPVAPYLIDFGWARKFPGGGCLRGDHGSVEWSSIRTAEGGPRRPEDDLEALGWMLLSGLFKELPWFDFLQTAYADGWQGESRDRAVTRAKEKKLQLLEKGWESLGYRWRSFEFIPDALLKFIRATRVPVSPPRLPDYKHLLAQLGGKNGLSQAEAEAEDLRQYEECILPLL
eukprot:gnl/TRDRNA2_/TRDRNA2_171942_c0_seq1.p1 gnl/TRDRNA2_/TRDRNA2_171942_c0~~gnl/TRDRNA2_/TRDRNA2_171942_c0_seq1.p1  ORF type:complete len:220 (-),score=32.52 gnl/TRDRNA2_/TRDRNA2_171942_c0_seq1:3-662(-)